MNEDFMTSEEVMIKYKISKYTLLNWRRGYYFRRNVKTYFFVDRSMLEAEWNEDERRLEYSPIKVAVWVNKLKVKNERGHHE